MIEKIIYIHTNYEQMIGAKLAKYALEKNQRKKNSFSVKILVAEDNSALKTFDGVEYIYKKKSIKFNLLDVQSFTLLRFSPPSLMGYNGLSIVIDPDVFWISERDPVELFELVNDNIAVACVHDHHFRTSMMIMNNKLLNDWSIEEALEKLRSGTPYKDIIELSNFDKEIRRLPSIYNSFDKVEDETLFVHYTRRQTQPWKEGLPYREKLENQGFIRKIYRKLRGRGKGIHIKHPNKVALLRFIELFKSALENGAIKKNDIDNELKNKNISALFLKRVIKPKNNV
jgi:hypothetical protein